MPSLTLFKNPEKRSQEKWTKKRDLLDIPHPFRALLAGPPSSGKSLLTLNFLTKRRKLWHEGFIVHFGGGDSPEYAKSGLEPLDELPEPKDDELFPDDGKRRVLVLEDLDFSSLTGDEKSRLDRLLGWTSSHRSLSIIATTQQPFGLPPTFRRLCNVFGLWKTADASALGQIASRCGLTKDDLMGIFNDKGLIKGPHDFLLIDLTEGTPAHLRVNGYQVLKEASDPSV